MISSVDSTVHGCENVETVDLQAPPMRAVPIDLFTIQGGSMARILILALSTLALSGCFYDGHRGHGYDHRNDNGHYSCPGGCNHPNGNGDWHNNPGPGYNR